MYNYVFLMLSLVFVFSNCTPNKKAADLFSDKGVSVNLVDINKGTEYDPENENSGLQIFVGKPNEQYQPVYGNENRIWINGKFYILSEVPLQCALYFSKTEKEKQKIVAFIDGETPVSFIRDFFVQLYKNGIDEMHFAVKNDKDSKSGIAQVLYRMDGKVIDENDLDKNFKEWFVSK